MIDYTTWTDQAMNEECARRCGWLVYLPGWRDSNHKYWEQSPDYGNSLDACIRDFVPVLQKHAMVDLSYYFDSGLNAWTWTCDIEDGKYSAYDTNLARAIRLCFLKATEE